MRCKPGDQPRFRVCAFSELNHRQRWLPFARVPLGQSQDDAQDEKGKEYALG